MTNSLPANPHARDLHLRAEQNPLSSEAIGLLAVAHELRTANLQRQAAAVASGPDFTDAPPDAYLLWEALQRDIGTRLGAPT